MKRPIAKQVVVITGASSGIGRETAIHFARCGASLVLAARNESALNSVAAEVRSAGGRAEVVVTDVADAQQVERLATEAVRAFGRIDTWINDAAVSEYATFEQMTDEEFRRIVDVNLMGPVYGTRAALRQMKQQGGGTIINIGSVLSDRAVPLQSAYVATKHALKGFSDAIRMEQETENSGVQITLILPASINTPLFDHARSKMEVEPKPIPPVYEPSVVAEAILYASQHKVREVYAGGFGKFLSIMQRISPRLVDWYMMQGGRMFEQQKDRRPNQRRDNLQRPSAANGAARGRFGQQSSSSSLYTRYVDPHPFLRGAVVGAIVLGAAAALVGIGRASKPAQRRHGRVIGRRPIEDPRETIARDAYVPVVKAMLAAGIDPRHVPGFDRLNATFLERLRTASAIARAEAEADYSPRPLHERLGRTFRRAGSRALEAIRSG